MDESRPGHINYTFHEDLFAFNNFSMTIDVADLREFYATPLGKSAEKSILREVRRLGGFFDGNPKIDMVGIGYPLPVLSELPSAEEAIVLMPARQGALQWPANGPNRVALVDEDELPIETASVQCVIVQHLLENVSDPAAMLDEIWRILVPEGRLILIATNRRGLWARFEHTPFGNGRPFSKGQLHKLLRKAKLTPTRWGDCLNYPPIRFQRLMRLYPYVETVAHRVWPVFCGAFVVCATKRLYQGVSADAKEPKRVTIPVLAPQNVRNAHDSATPIGSR